MSSSNEKPNTRLTFLERKDLIRQASKVINKQYHTAFQKISKR